MHSGDRRILDHLRHCAAAKAVTLRGGAIGKDREMNGRFVQSSELESGVKAGALRRLRAQSLRIACRKIFANSGAARPILDNDEAPGLAQADRRSKASQFDQALEHAVRQRIGPETADVPPPQQKIAQARAKRRVEIYRPRRGCESILRVIETHDHGARLEHDPEKWIPVFGKDHAHTQQSKAKWRFTITPFRFNAWRHRRPWPSAAAPSPLPCRADRSAATMGVPENCGPKFQRGRDDETGRMPPACAPAGTARCRRRSRARHLRELLSAGPPPLSNDCAPHRSRRDRPRPSCRSRALVRRPPMGQAWRRAAPRAAAARAQSRAGYRRARKNCRMTAAPRSRSC